MNLWLYLFIAAFPLGLLFAVFRAFPSRKLGFLAFNIPAMLLSPFLVVTVPPVPMLFLFLLLLFALFSRRALMLFAYASAALYNALFVVILLDPFPSSRMLFSGLMLGCALLGGLLLGARHARYLPEPTTGGRSSWNKALLSLVLVCYAGGIVWMFGEKIASSVASFGSPALSGALMHIGFFPTETSEDALFILAKKQGTHEQLLRDMLQAKGREAPWLHGRPQSLRGIVRKLMNRYQSPELVEEAIILLKQESKSEARETLLSLAQTLNLPQEEALLKSLERHQFLLPDLVEKSGANILGEVVRFKNIELVRYLLHNSPKENVQKALLHENRLGFTPLAEAAFTNQPEVLALLLAYTEKPLTTDSRGRNLLHIAAMNTTPQSLGWLINNLDGAEELSRAKDNFGANPIHYAALGSCKEGVALIASRTPVSDVQDNNGQSPLHLAASFEMRQLPALEGLSLQLEPQAGGTKCTMLFTLFSLAGNEPMHEPDAMGRTPLHYAAIPLRNGRQDSSCATIKALLDAGLNPLLPDNEQRTPHDLFEGFFAE